MLFNLKQKIQFWWKIETISNIIFVRNLKEWCINNNIPYRKVRTTYKKGIPYNGFLFTKLGKQIPMELKSI